MVKLKVGNDLYNMKIYWEKIYFKSIAMVT